MSAVREQFWAADPHRYGPGKLHIVDDEDTSKTYCGQLLDACPGKPVTAGIANCKICLNAKPKRIESRARSEEYQREWEQRRRDEESARATEEREWRMRYNAHLQSSKWREIRALVLGRSGGVCEGCGKRQAAHAHHLTYAHMGDEFLWELRAVCVDCHERFHEDRDR